MQRVVGLLQVPLSHYFLVAVGRCLVRAGPFHSVLVLCAPFRAVPGIGGRIDRFRGLRADPGWGTQGSVRLRSGLAAAGSSGTCTGSSGPSH